MTVRWHIGVSVASMVFGVSTSRASQSDEVATPRIVFVCEHGAGKSVIAAAYFA
jgi:hypothetical protein